MRKGILFEYPLWVVTSVVSKDLLISPLDLDVNLNHKLHNPALLSWQSKRKQRWKILHFTALQCASNALPSKSFLPLQPALYTLGQNWSLGNSKRSANQIHFLERIGCAKRTSQYSYHLVPYVNRRKRSLISLTSIYSRLRLNQAWLLLLAWLPILLHLPGYL